MRYCSQCLQPDTRPGTTFSDKGICPACLYYESILKVDWDERIEILHDIIKDYKSNNVSQHDCIMGVSGGKDSTRQAIFLKENLGLNPLLVCLSYPPEQVSEVGVNNISNLINLGFDVIISAPAPVTWKSLKIEGFNKFTNSFRSTEMALFASVPQLAIDHKIKLIFWGENPALQVGDQSILGKTEYDGNNSRFGNTLSSGSDWMKEIIKNPIDLIPYHYPSEADFRKYGLQIIYLGWFMGDWSLLNNGLYASSIGPTLREDNVDETGDLYGISAIDEDHTPVNQLIKYYKFGFGKATEYVNEEIRLNRISRNEGIKIVEDFDGKLHPKYIKNYCKYLNMNEDYFWSKIKKSLNKDLFEIDSNGKISKKFKVGYGI